MGNGAIAACPPGAEASVSVINVENVTPRKLIASLCKADAARIKQIEANDKAGKPIPSFLVQHAFNRLGPGGIVALNVCDFSSRSPALEAIRNTVASVFGTVYELRLSGTQTSLLYAGRDDAPADLETVRRNLEDPAFASASEAPALRALLLGAVPYRTAHAYDPGIRVLTDDCAPVEALMDASFRRVRSGMRTE